MTSAYELRAFRTVFAVDDDDRRNAVTVEELMKRVIEFTEGIAEARELTEAEAAQYGIRVSEESAPALNEIKKSITESYQKLGLSESEAKLAADLDLGKRLY